MKESSNNDTGSKSYVLHWHKDDPEQKIGFRGGRYTSPNKFLSLLIACVLTVVSFAGLVFVAGSWGAAKPCADIFMERGPTQYVVTAFFFWALCMLWMKSLKIKFQRKAFDLPIMPADPSFSLSPETARDVLHRLHEAVDHPGQFAVLNRIERALSNLDNIGNTSDVTAILKIQSENDESQVASSYGLINGLMWAIPVLGFIGTVLGLSQAIGAFGATLAQEGNIDGIKGSLSLVTAGLSTAFDTTLVALIMALILQLIVSLLQAREAEWLDACNEYCNRKVAGRLRLRENNPQL
jgi:biopolymer transport protein ExbB/TolQ